MYNLVKMVVKDKPVNNDHHRNLNLNLVIMQRVVKKNISGK